MATVFSGYKGIPRVHRRTITAVRADLSSGEGLAEHAEALKNNGQLWEELRRGAKEIAGDNPEMLEQIMRYGGRMIEITRCSYEIDDMEQRFSEPSVPEPPQVS